MSVDALVEEQCGNEYRLVTRVTIKSGELYWVFLCD